MFNEETCILTATNGKEYRSIGCVDYGNNNFFEVMVTEEFRTKKNTFQPVFGGYEIIPSENIMFCSHDDGLDSDGISIGEFFSNLDAHHLVDVVGQLQELFK